MKMNITQRRAALGSGIALVVLIGTGIGLSCRNADQQFKSRISSVFRDKLNRFMGHPVGFEVDVTDIQQNSITLKAHRDVKGVTFAREVTVNYPSEVIEKLEADPLNQFSSDNRHAITNVSPNNIQYGNWSITEANKDERYRGQFKTDVETAFGNMRVTDWDSFPHPNTMFGP